MKNFSWPLAFIILIISLQIGFGVHSPRDENLDQNTDVSVKVQSNTETERPEHDKILESINAVDNRSSGIKTKLNSEKLDVANTSSNIKNDANISHPNYKNNMMIVLTEANFPPFEFIDENKHLTGFDIDLMNAIAAELHWDVEYISVKFDNIFDEIKNNSSTIAIADIFISQKRVQKFIFSDPYIESDPDQLIINKKYLKDALNGELDLNSLRNHKVCVEAGSIHVDILKKMNFKNIIECGNNKICNEYYTIGKCSGIFRSEYVNRYAIKHGLIKDAFESGFYVYNVSNKSGIMLNKDNIAARDLINETIKKLKVNGTIDKLHEKWFGPLIPSQTTHHETHLK